MRPKRRWIKWVTWSFFLCVAFAILLPIFGQPRDPHKRSSCQSNLKQILISNTQYIQDYDQHYPLVSYPTTPGGFAESLSSGLVIGWSIALLPYGKSSQIYQCPLSRIPLKPFHIDYFYNAQLAQISETKIDDPASTIVLGDGQYNAHSSAHLSQLPLTWTTNKKSPANRHAYVTNDLSNFLFGKRYGANYAFADGHVKWLAPQNITPQSFQRTKTGN